MNEEEKRGPGRPRYLTFEGGRRITVRIPEADVETIEAVAGNTREGLSGWVRNVIGKAAQKEREKLKGGGRK